MLTGASTSLALMVNLNESEAQTFQQILNGERLWSWPNGRLQLGHTFPDVTVINRFMRDGLLDHNYQQTNAWRSELLFLLLYGSTNNLYSSALFCVIYHSY